MVSEEKNIKEKKILLVTFSDNADHQDITFGMFEELFPTYNAWILAINNPKVNFEMTPHTHLVDCPTRPGICKKTFDVVEMFRIIRWIKKGGFDIVFFETLHVWNLPIMILCHKKCRIFQMIHDLIPHQGDRQAKLVDLMNRVVCKISDYIVLPNKKYLSMVTELYGILQSKVVHIDLWRRFPPFENSLLQKRVLFFGRINPYKGIDNLLDIAKECTEIQFDVVGRVDKDMEKIVDELDRLPNVSLNNNYVTNDEMANAFKCCSFVILPYNSATQSGVVIDAYRFGKPVIAFDVGAISEQVVDGKTGYLVQPKNSKEFARKLNEVMQMSLEQYNNMRIYAYSYGIEKYSSIGAVERFLELIEWNNG